MASRAPAQPPGGGLLVLPCAPAVLGGGSGLGSGDGNVADGDVTGCGVTGGVVADGELACRAGSGGGLFVTL